MLKSGDLIIRKCNGWCLFDICLDNMKCQHSETGTVCLCSKTVL